MKKTLFFLSLLASFSYAHASGFERSDISNSGEEELSPEDRGESRPMDLVDEDEELREALRLIKEGEEEKEPALAPANRNDHYIPFQPFLAEDQDEVEEKEQREVLEEELPDLTAFAYPACAKFIWGDVISDDFMPNAGRQRVTRAFELSVEELEKKVARHKNITSPQSKARMWFYSWHLVWGLIRSIEHESTSEKLLKLKTALTDLDRAFQDNKETPLKGHSGLGNQFPTHRKLRICLGMGYHKLAQSLPEVNRFKTQAISKSWGYYDEMHSGQIKPVKLKEIGLVLVDGFKIPGKDRDESIKIALKLWNTMQKDEPVTPRYSRSSRSSTSSATKKNRWATTSVPIDQTARSRKSKALEKNIFQKAKEERQRKAEQIRQLEAFAGDLTPPPLNAVVEGILESGPRDEEGSADPFKGMPSFKRRSDSDTSPPRKKLSAKRNRQGETAREQRFEEGSGVHSNEERAIDSRVRSDAREAVYVAERFWKDSEVEVLRNAINTRDEDENNNATAKRIFEEGLLPNRTRKAIAHKIYGLESLQKKQKTHGEKREEK